jgi:multidrug resistance efflux pump
MAAAAEKADKNVIPLRLPHIGDEGQPGARFVKRAVGLTLSTLFGLVAAGLLVASLVSMDVTVKSTGVLEPVKIYPVRAMESGPVREVLVQTGDTVAAGQVLARLDTLQLAASLAQLEAQYRSTDIDRRRSASADPLERRRLSQRGEQSAARLSTARATLRQRMVEYDLGTNLDSLLQFYRPGSHVALDQAVGEVRAAEAEMRLSGSEAALQDLTSFDRAKLGAQMDQLSAQIAAARERMGRLVLTSPIDGVVLTERIERLPGAFVREGDQILEVANLHDWRVQLTVSERDVHKIEVGDSVKVEVQAFNQAEREMLGGRVVYVSPEPASAQGQGGSGGAAAAQAAPAAGPGTYRVIAALNEAEIERMGLEKFRRGYSVRGHIITRSGRILTLLWNYLTEKLES